MSISERLFEALETTNIRSSDLADKIGVDAAVLSNWKRRNTDPPAKLIIPICNALHISVNWLLTGDNDVKTVAASLPPDEEKALNYYHRLNDENRDYVRGKMVELIREQDANTPPNL